jgi:GT2 family glycosyltransferase
MMRLLFKLYEYTLRCYTLMIRGFESDPSKILLDHYTEEQTKAQAVLDSKFRELKELKGDLLVIIPFKDRWDLTSVCLQTLNDQAIPSDLVLRVVLVDNGSASLETEDGIKSAAAHYLNLNIETLRANYPFNFSKLNNDAFKKFRSNATRWVLFLNNDVSLNDKTIISRMTSCLESVSEAGAVGCTLLYPDRRIQHIFAAPGVKIIAAHPLKGTRYSEDLAWFSKPARPVAAVTGAVLMTRAADFETVGMFDENLPTLGQDIILSCMLVENLSRFNVVINSSDVIHHESPTKKSEFPALEIKYIYNVYGDRLSASKFISDRFSRWSERPALILGRESQYPVNYVT